jgi:chromosome segregation ATPase
MEGDQLKLLEERIGKAIGFIENLKAREKTHLQQKEELEERVSSFEEEIKEKDTRIEELKESQVFLKEKIETILGKLESWADLVDSSGYDLDTPEVSEEDVPQSGIDLDDTGDMDAGDEESDDEVDEVNAQTKLSKDAAGNTLFDYDKGEMKGASAWMSEQSASDEQASGDEIRDDQESSNAGDASFGDDDFEDPVSGSNPFIES